MDNNDQPMSDRQWHASLFDRLAGDARLCARIAAKTEHVDAVALRGFAEWADEQAEELRRQYGIDG